MVEFADDIHSWKCKRVETLDLRSISLTLSLSGFALTAVLWAARRDGDAISGVDAWLMSAATMSAGLGLSALQGWVPEWAARVLGNTLLATAPMLAWQGARSFRGASSKLRAVIVVALATLLGNVILVYIWPSARLRVMLVSIIMAAACAAAGFEFLRQRQSHLVLAARFGGIPMLIFALMMTIRALDAFLRTEVQVTGALTPTPVNVATSLLGSVVLLCTIAGMVMSVTATRAEQIRELAYRDALTGALSRRGFYAALSRWPFTVSGAATVALLDANRFKLINDTLGHETGDRVLQALVRSCEKCLPTGSLIARFGGDEFVLMIPRSVDLTRVLTQIATAFVNESAVLMRGQDLPSPSIAFGSALIDHVTAEAFDRSLRLADAQMYAHKVQTRGDDRGVHP